MEVEVLDSLYFSEGDSQCSGNLSRPSCDFPQSELAKRDSIAILRTIFSILSILGTFSIIISVIVKRQVFSPKIHPIFILSIADFLLACLWVAGGTLWLGEQSSRKDSNRSGCFAILLTTVIMECITVNLTCVYALLAYFSIKQKNFSNVYSLLDKDARNQVWKPCTTILVYLIAWTAPIVVILPAFFALDKHYTLTGRANSCACSCVPFFGNVMPFAIPMDPPTKLYLHDLSSFILCYSVMVGIHYVLGFTLLLVIYWMVLLRIKKMRNIYKETMSHHNLYGATEAIIIKGQTQAKTRVLVFLTAFVITGFFNVILSIIMIRYAVRLSKYNPQQKIFHKHKIPSYVVAAYIFQSIAIPLQGFMNAIIYGWTREDFVKAIRTSQNSSGLAVAPPQSSVFQQQQQQQQQQQRQQQYRHRWQGGEPPHISPLLEASQEVDDSERTGNDIVSPGMLQILSEDSDSD